MDEPETESADVSTRPQRLVFHIGDYKTGSTSIQYAYAGGKVRFGGDASVVYPTNNQHNSLIRPIKTVGIGESHKVYSRAVGKLTQLAETIRTSSTSYGLISGETLQDVKPQLFRQVVDEYFRDQAADQVRVVAYVRPHAARLLSSFAEQSKLGWFQGSLEQFSRRTERLGRFSYFDRFSGWQEQFGDEFVLRPMIRSELRNQSVIDDFTAVAFDTSDFEVVGHADANQSLSLSDLVGVRFVQARYQEKGKWLRHALGCELARLLAAQPPVDQEGDDQPAPKPERVQLHRELAEQVHAFYIEDAKKMDQVFFDGRPLLQTELDQALENSLPEPQPLDVDAHFSAASQRQLGAMADLVVGMLDQDVPWSNHFRQETLTAQLA